MLRCAIPIFLSLISHALFAQNTQLDSLNQALENHPQNDTTKVWLLTTICSNIWGTDPKKNKDYAEQALAIAQNLEYTKGIADSYREISRYFWGQTEYDRSADYAIRALKEYERCNNQSGIAWCYACIGICYAQANNYDKAIEYHNRALHLNKKIDNKGGIAQSLNSLGYVNELKGNYRIALGCYKQALEIRKKRSDISDLIESLANVGSTYSFLKDYQQALEYLLTALPLAESLDNKNLIALIHQNIGEVYFHTSDYEDAGRYLKSALRLSIEIGDKKRREGVYTVLKNLEESRNNYKSAFHYLSLLQGVRDTLYTQDRSSQMAKMETLYETEKKEHTIELLQKDQKISVLWRSMLTAGIILLALTMFMIYRLQQSRTHKAKQLLLVQQSLNDKLQEMDKTKSHFFANISHEFRTPLTLILGPIEEKLATDKLDDKDKFTFQTIKRNSNRLLELVNQLLELSKLESGNMNLKLEPGNLKDALLSIISSFDSLADVNQVRYLKDVHMAEAIVLFDRDKLEKILSNLLSNAFKFTPQTGLIEFIGTTSEKGATTELQLKIRNTGPMIPTEMLNKIFEPFFQGENAAYRGMQGTGLGLSLVRELVKLHKGTVEVSSDEKGTVFTVLLKFENSLQRIDTFKQVDLVHRPIISTEEMVESRDDLSIEENGRDTVLIVEDNTDVRAFIRRGLESSYHILEAPHGEAGLHLANEQVPHLIIADVMMPKMSGIDLCYQLKNNEKTSHIPVIMLTARADHESKLEGLKTGADDYLIKPFNPEELVVRVNNLIEQRKKLAQKYNQKLIVQPHEIAVSSLDERFIQKIIKVVETHLDDTQLSVDMVTTELGMSRTNLHKKLKAITGLATSEFIQDFRLRRAAQLIDKKTDNFAQIAFQVGFADQSYFTKCFKKKFGKTPSEYANLQQEN